MGREVGAKVRARSSLAQTTQNSHQWFQGPRLLSLVPSAPTSLLALLSDHISFLLSLWWLKKSRSAYLVLPGPAPHAMAASRLPLLCPSLMPLQPRWPSSDTPAHRRRGAWAALCLEHSSLHVHRAHPLISGESAQMPPSPDHSA